MYVFVGGCAILARPPWWIHTLVGKCKHIHKCKDMHLARPRRAFDSRASDSCHHCTPSDNFESFATNSRLRLKDPDHAAKEGGQEGHSSEVEGDMLLIYVCHMTDWCFDHIHSLSSRSLSRIRTTTHYRWSKRIVNLCMPYDRLMFWSYA